MIKPFEKVEKVSDEGRVLDVDFMAFNKVQHVRLIQKIKIHRIHGVCIWN